MIPIIIWGGTQTGANSLKEHLRLFGGETPEYRKPIADELIPLVKDKFAKKRLENGQWPFKHIFKNINLNNYYKIFEKNMIVRIHHGDFLDRSEIYEIILKAQKYNYNHIFLYRESLFDQSLGWFYEDHGSSYEKILPDPQTFKDSIEGIKKDLVHTYNFIKDKIDLKLISYEMLYLRRERKNVRDILNSFGYNLTVDDIDTFIYNRYKHLNHGNKFKIDDIVGPISESKSF